MLFNSFSFAIFLPIVFLIYWTLPHKFRWILLLISSYFFYMCWNPGYVILIFITTIVSYTCGRIIENNKKWIKNLTLMLTLVICLGILFIFKYYNFFMSILARFIVFVPRSIELLLRVGISFYTFQTVSYVIDVYKGTCKAEKNIGIYATFISFFPQLVAGPIERSTNLLPQIRNRKEYNSYECYYGIRLIVWGIYKKVLVADNLAVYVDAVYSDIYNHPGCSILLATIFFTFQIYCDFSGYTDIARGSAKVLGINLMENFNSPYFSISIKDFWSRWHISLSTWFRDYLYITLGGDRVSKFRNSINVIITFLISGLWHGANWKFVVWGGIHGIAQVYEKAFGIKSDNNNSSFYLWIRRLVVFLFVSFAWIFFRANGLREALYAIKAIPHGITDTENYLRCGIDDMGLKISSVPYLVLYFVPLTVFDFYKLKIDPIERIGQLKGCIQSIIIALIIVILLLLGYTGQSTFVYFQF